MKIGILTFHSQLNYGGVLQCWALQTVLSKHGFDVIVVDRRPNADNSMLERGYDKWCWQQWLKFWIRSLFGLGDFQPWLRVMRTKKFLKLKLKLTSYNFIAWENAPKNLGIDALVVGSDQVWHCGDWGDPGVFLLEGAKSIRAISYAASFGMNRLPLDFLPLYKKGLRKFAAVSCREKEGVVLCKELGIVAKHVIDPTLLVSGEEWRKGLEIPMRKKNKTLVCYFLGESIEAVVPKLEEFAEKEDCRVKVFLDRSLSALMPFSAERFKEFVRYWRLRHSARISICDSAGPIEFVKAFASAEWVVSDSFHALMFSVIFGCNVRIISPSSSSRLQMFARIKEFQEHIDGPIIVDSVAAALNSFEKKENVKYDYLWIDSRRRESEEWLLNNLK